MQWVFLVIALLAALVEMHTGTFYLAGVAAVAIISALLGFWVPGEWLIVAFVTLCACVIGALMVRRQQQRGRALPDFDIGQTVRVESASGANNRLAVAYRGAIWEAVADDGSVLAPGDIAVIARRADKLLHLTAPSKTATI